MISSVKTTSGFMLLMSIGMDSDLAAKLITSVLAPISSIGTASTLPDSSFLSSAIAVLYPRSIPFPSERHLAKSLRKVVFPAPGGAAMIVVAGLPSIINALTSGSAHPYAS